MLTKSNTMSIARLLAKVAGYIGFSTVHYLNTVLLSKWPMNPVELEILERTFTMGLYSDELLETSCHTAIIEQNYKVCELPFLIERVQKQMRQTE